MLSLVQNISPIFFLKYLVYLSDVFIWFLQHIDGLDVSESTSALIFCI